MQKVHQQLIEHAREARAASLAGDRAEVTRRSTALLADLAIHLDDERLAVIKLDALDPALADTLRRRQREVVERLLELADEPSPSDGACHCRELADDIVALLDEEVTAEEVAIDTYELPAGSRRSVRGVPTFGHDQS